MGLCMAMTWLVTKCSLVDGLMYGYYMAGHQLSPNCPLVDRCMYGYYMAGHKVSPGGWAHVWL